MAAATASSILSYSRSYDRVPNLSDMNRRLLKCDAGPTEARLLSASVRERLWLQDSRRISVMERGCNVGGATGYIEGSMNKESSEQGMRVGVKGSHRNWRQWPPMRRARTRLHPQRDSCQTSASCPSFCVVGLGSRALSDYSEKDLYAAWLPSERASEQEVPRDGRGG